MTDDAGKLGPEQLKEFADLAVQADTNMDAAEWLAGLRRAVERTRFKSIAADAGFALSLTTSGRGDGTIAALDVVCDVPTGNTDHPRFMCSYPVIPVDHVQAAAHDSPSQWLGSVLGDAWSWLSAHVIEVGDYEPDEGDSDDK